MVKAFISYRHRQPDEGLAAELAAYLRERGVDIFWDKQIRVGQSWPDEIKSRLRSADVFIVLLSRESVRSKALRREVFFASRLRRKVRILPVCLGEIDIRRHLPEDLAYDLDLIQSITWKPGEPTEPIFSALLAEILGHPALPDSRGAWRDSQSPVERPYPQVDLDTGVMSPESSFYVCRRADREIEVLLRSYSFAALLRGPGKSGKSSCLVRAGTVAAGSGYCPIYVDIGNFVSSELVALEVFLKTLARRIADALAIKARVVDEMWDPGENGKENFAYFFQEQVLERLNRPVLLILDGVDTLLDHSFREDFFISVRDWHGRRVRHPLWARLSLILGHASDPVSWITRSGTPFNIGQPIWLEDFSMDEVARINASYGNPLRGVVEIKRLSQLIGGHPFLVRRAFYALTVGGLTLSGLTKNAYNVRGPFGDHLWSLARNLVDLREEVLSIARGDGCSDEMVFQHLLARGIASGERRSEARLRCGLYQRYFLLHL